MNPADVRATARPDYARSHGCALFLWQPGDKVHRPEVTGGLFSLGGEPAIPFQRPSDLPTDVVWWTNLSDAEALRLGNWNRIKPASFLGGDWITQISEWGAPRSNEELAFACASWAEVLGRMGEWLSRWAERQAIGAPVPALQAPSLSPQGRSWGGPAVPSVEASEAIEPYRHPQWSWGRGSLAEALAWRLGWVQTGAPAHEALKAAWLPRVDSLTAPDLRSGQVRRITLVLPRLPHAQAILATRVPLGNFTEIPPSEWPRGAEERWDVIAHQTRPTLVRLDKVRWRPGRERLAEVWWGRRGRRFSASDMDPVWMTAEEALDARDLIDTIPEAALRAPEWDSVLVPQDWPVYADREPGALPVAAALTQNSLVSELLADNLWRAGASKFRPPDRTAQAEISARAVWWRSADRRRTWPAVSSFTRRGFNVLSWGEGSLTIQFHPDQVLKADWLAAVRESGVRVPAALARESSFIDPASLTALAAPVPFTASDIDAWLKEHHGIEARLWLDRLLWPWPNPDERKVNTILKAAAQDLTRIPTPSDAWRKTWVAMVVEAGRSAVASLAAARTKSA